MFVGFAAGQTALPCRYLQRRFPVHVAFLHDFLHAARQRQGCHCGSRGVNGFAVRRPDQQRDLTARRFLPHVRQQLLEMSAQKLLIDLGHFARDNGGAIAENLERVLERVEQPVRRFIERQGARLRCQYA